ncbi:hypothetical protein DPMN_132590 [Dreissena polymorpha]|uniref:Uncharacterized protein n=1 Tax=Dreissena polymorpha TaxID=45954 RepID=A0A9D4J914_DREPO|nr:hypothetical protein DPMN_132590 [Dreissena polymorpha]
METYWRDVSWTFMTIPQYFHNHGIITAGIEKIFHSGFKADPIPLTGLSMRQCRIVTFVI